MKKAKKKSGGNKKSSKPIDIHLQDSIGAVPLEPDARKNKPSGPGDRVRWSNETSVGLTLTFSVWPFVEPSKPIMIAAGGQTGWFHISLYTITGRHGYTIDPTINPTYGPPDSPAVIVLD